MNWGLYVLSKGEVFTGSQVVLHEEEEEEEEEDLSPRSLSRICSNIFANDGEAEEVLGAIVVVVVVVRPSFSSLSGELETRQKILKNPNPKP